VFFHSCSLSELELMQPHVNAPAAKRHAFVFEAQPLFESRRAAQFDFTAGSNHALPGDRAMSGAQRPRDLPRVTRIAGGSRLLWGFSRPG
jgi:hypothetical protein